MRQLVRILCKLSTGKIFKNMFIHFRTEKNACAWSQDKIKELFTNLEIEEDDSEFLTIYFDH